MIFSDSNFLNAAKNAFKADLTPADIDALDTVPDERKALHILEHSHLTEAEIARRIADIADADFEAKTEVADSPESVVPLRVIVQYQCMPSARGALAVSWPPSADMDGWITAITGKRAHWTIAPASTLNKLIAEKFGVGADSLTESDATDLASTDDADFDEDENAAIIKFVNELITRALADRATDIHIEPQKNSLEIRYRIDGDLAPVRLPANLARFKDAIISRVKIMARLNISEKRRPQDGRITFAAKNGEEIDIRVSSLPTLYGESVSLRLLSQKAQPLSIADIGFTPEDAEKIKIPLARPHGIILVTGPTGSGKSTTLTAFIRRLKKPEIRIVTVEDPVEYEVEGVNQTQVQPEIGLTFSSVLRSVLRQDPDVIMVGEIRDRETADIAIRASLTGHLVLSTLHTNDASGALTRLIDMDIEPFLIASSVEMILAQRLVRRLCSCAERANYAPSYVAECLKALEEPASELENMAKIMKPRGCDKCRHLGYFGRVGIFEILLMNEEIHSMIVRRATAQEIRAVARRHGMRTLQECGWELVKRGLTGLDEVMYYANTPEE